MSLKQLLELLLKLGAEEDELREGIHLYDKITVKESPQDEIESPRMVAKTKLPSKNGNGHSTRTYSTLPLQDWMTTENAGKKLGVPTLEVERIGEEKGLVSLSFSRAPNLVHVRQIAYWIEHHAVLPVDHSVFNSWVRQTEIARQMGVPDYKVAYLVSSKQVAVFNPDPRIVLVNEREVAKRLKGDN